MIENRFWVRFWTYQFTRDSVQPMPKTGMMIEKILDASEVRDQIASNPKFQMVQLDTGIVLRNDYKKLIPKWL